MQRAILPIDSLIFDLDGTLWDTCSACAVSWNNVAQLHGISFRGITENDVRSVAGKSHEACVREVFQGLPEEQIAILVRETQTEDNRVIAQLGGSLYFGVAEGLKELSSTYPLFIVSNCQRGYIELFLESTQLARVFRDFECWGNTGQSKADNLRNVIRRNNLQAPAFVGDTEGDEQAALACDVPFIYAAYGYGKSGRFALLVNSFGELCAAQQSGAIRLGRVPTD